MQGRLPRQGCSSTTAAACSGAGARACVWWSTECALVRMRLPEMRKPELVLLNWRLRCQGSEKFGSLCMQKTCAWITCTPASGNLLFLTWEHVCCIAAVTLHTCEDASRRHDNLGKTGGAGCNMVGTECASGARLPSRRSP